MKNKIYYMCVTIFMVTLLGVWGLTSCGQSNFDEIKDIPTAKTSSVNFRSRSGSARTENAYAKPAKESCRTTGRRSNASGAGIGIRRTCLILLRGAAEIRQDFGA